LRVVRLPLAAFLGEQAAARALKKASETGPGRPYHLAPAPEKAPKIIVRESSTPFFSK
jgi:hypothetical protein